MHQWGWLKIPAFSFFDSQGANDVGNGAYLGEFSTFPRPLLGSLEKVDGGTSGTVQ